MADNNEKNTSVGKKLAAVSLMFFGAIIGIISLLLFKSNVYIFTIFISLYFIIYCIVIIVYLYRKTNVNNPEFNMIINTSMYSICLLISIIAVAIYLMNASNQYKYASKY